MNPLEWFLSLFGRDPYDDNTPLDSDAQAALDRVNRRVMWEVKTKLTPPPSEEPTQDNDKTDNK